MKTVTRNSPTQPSVSFNPLPPPRTISLDSEISVPHGKPHRVEKKTRDVPDNWKAAVPDCLALYRHSDSFLRSSYPLSLVTPASFLQPFILGPLSCFSSELIWNCGSYILHRTTQTQEKRGQTSVPRVGFEPTIPVFERARTFRALYRAATVFGCPVPKGLRLSEKTVPKDLRNKKYVSGECYKGKVAPVLN
jgi:hypothetical protein